MFCEQGDYAESFLCVLLEFKKSTKLGWNILRGAGRTIVGQSSGRWTELQCQGNTPDNKLIPK